jgi:enediyne biosynthesis protein E3
MQELAVRTESWRPDKTWQEAAFRRVASFALPRCMEVFCLFRLGETGVRQTSGARIRTIIKSFSDGFRIAMDAENPEEIASRLHRSEKDFQGFAFEGAAAGLTLLDCVSPVSFPRLTTFIHGEGKDFRYLLYVGAGWIYALRSRWREKFLLMRDPVLSWLMIDGVGFLHGFFRVSSCLDRGNYPNWLKGYARRVFDQGLGRSLWFVETMDSARIAARIESFDPQRQPDLWSGLGLAAVYAGEVDRSTLNRLRQSAKEYWKHLAQGAAFGAKARSVGRNLTEYQEVACLELCDCSAVEAAKITDTALVRLGTDVSDRTSAYEAWREETQRILSNK